MIKFNIPLAFAMSLVIWLGSTGCSKPASSNSTPAGGSAATDGSASTGSPAANITGSDKEAADTVTAEINNHWATAADGWITARITGSAYAPDHFIRELREITVTDVEPDTLTDADKLNGVDWVGSVKFKQTSCREAGDPGMALEGLSTPTVNRQRGQWCQWVDWQPDPIRLQRTKGQWQIDQDTWILRGTLPTSQDFTNAGVK